MSGNLVHLVANVWGERFGEEEVTRSDETTASELEENDLFFELDGSQEKVADFLGPEERSRGFGISFWFKLERRPTMAIACKVGILHIPDEIFL